MAQHYITSERINSISSLINAKTYLEIGVWNGDTFRNVVLLRRHGVDPCPLFDLDSLLGSDDSFSTTTSDEFFVDGSTTGPFDIIFIDGLHTFEQALRDFINSVSLSHPRTVWIIDDVFPSDCFSALASSKDCFASRKILGQESKAWHGDVYRLAFFIHDFFPLFDFRLITDKGNPQMIVIQSRRTGFAPRWNSVESIARLCYSDFLLNKDILNEVDEDAAMQWILASLSPNIL